MLKSIFASLFLVSACTAADLQQTVVIGGKLILDNGKVANLDDTIEDLTGIKIDIDGDDDDDKKKKKKGGE